MRPFLFRRSPSCALHATSGILRRYGVSCRDHRWAGITSGKERTPRCRLSTRFRCIPTPSAHSGCRPTSLRNSRRMSNAGLLKVLVVEDEAVVALDIENLLEEIGCKVVASVPRLLNALYLAGSLDIDLAGEVVYPLAFRLAERGIPFVFSTGYSTSTLPSELRDRPLVKKPVTLGSLKKAVSMATTGMRIVR